MKKSVLVAACLLYAFIIQAQSTDQGKTPSGKPGLLKLKPGEHVSSENAGKVSTPAKDSKEELSKAEDSNNIDFQDYVKNVHTEISENDKSISELQNLLTGKRKNNYSKQLKTIASLAKENEELKSDLDNYVKYGLGDWRVFQKEFSKDLTAVASDLNILDQEYLPGDFISDNSK